MALKPCPECKHQISETAMFCPSCGHQSKSDSHPNTSSAAIKAVPEYSSIPWYRRSRWNTAFIVIGFITKGYIPLTFAACLIVLTGDVYYNERLPNGDFKKWSKGNKVAAILFLLLNVWLIWYLTNLSE